MANFWQWQGDASTGAGYVKFTGSQTVVISGTATAVISGTATVVVSGTATVNFSGSGTVAVSGNVTVGGKLQTNSTMVFSSSGTFSSGATATSALTFAVAALTAVTTVAHELFVTNDGPYEVTADLYKTISAGATVNVNTGTRFAIPAYADSAGVTVGGKSIQTQGLFNVNLGLTLRLTVTAAFTALVTSYCYIKELDL